MESKRWLRVKTLFHAAAAVKKTHRETFLAERCGPDAGLKTEVESLLARHDRGGNFLERPAPALAAGWLSPDDSQAPERVGAWRIVREVGHGGMARVFLAERDDRQFSKKAAVKILAWGVYGDDARRRLVRERQLLADLDHPNIVRLIDGGVTEDHRPYLVMDFVDGKPITQHATEQRLALPQRLELFLEVCGAVQYAHEHSVVHRDLKPDNVLVTPEGAPKLLDFGIAKLLETGDKGKSGATTRGSHWLTPEYASPEQVRGEPATRATDVYALGLMLYEILLVRRPFQLDSVPMYEAARVVCKQTPDLAELPPGLARIIGKAIRKNPAERYASVREFAADIRNYLETSGRQWLAGRTAGRTRDPALVHRARLRWAWLAAAVLVGGSTVFVVSRRSETTARPASSETLLSSSGGMNPSSSLTTVCLTPDARLLETAPSLSPDGNRLAYVRHGPEPGLFVRYLPNGVPRRLTSDTDGCPKWSPDGQQIAFTRWTYSGERKVYVIPSSGGVERPAGVMQAWDIAWSPDGRFIAGSDRERADAPLAIHFVSVETGVRRGVTLPPDGIRGDVTPEFSPDGKSMAFVRYHSEGVGDIYVVPITGGQPRAVTSDHCSIYTFAWTPDSRELIFSSNRSGSLGELWRIQPFTAEPPRRVRIRESEGSSVFPTLSRRAGAGRARLVYVRLMRNVDVWRSEWDGREFSSPHTILGSNWSEQSPAFSHNGRFLAFVSDGSGHKEIWASGSDGNNPVQLTALKSTYVDSPAWSPDGEQIAFAALPAGTRRIFIVGRNGGNPQRLTQDDAEEDNPRWSRDGRYVYFGSRRGGHPEVWKAEPGNAASLVRVTHGGGWAAEESPDGSRLYFLRGPASHGLYSMPIPGSAEILVAPTVAVQYWGVARKGVYFIDFHHSERVEGVEPVKIYRFDTGKIVEAGSVPAGWPTEVLPGFSVSSDGSALAWTRVKQHTSQLMMVDKFE